MSRNCDVLDEDWIPRPTRVAAAFRGYVATKNHEAIVEDLFPTPIAAIHFISTRVQHEIVWTKTATSPTGIELWQGGHPSAMAEDREIRASGYKKAADPKVREELTEQEWWDRYYVEPYYENENIEIEGAEYVRGLSPRCYIVKEGDRSWRVYCESNERMLGSGMSEEEALEEAWREVLKHKYPPRTQFLGPGGWLLLFAAAILFWTRL